MQTRFSFALVLILSCAASAQEHPNISGAWDQYRGGPGTDPKLAPPRAGELVLKPEYAKPYQERQAAEAAATKRGEQLANAGSQCIPYGMPTMLAIAIYPIEILETADQVTIITEAFSEVRRIYLNKPQMPIDEVPPGYYGRSVGKWEGDTLVVDTVGVKTQVNGYRGIPHSEKMRITERFRLVSPDILHDTITIEDPVTLAKPVTYTLGFKRNPGYEMVEFVCENNREFIDEKGIVRMKVQDK